MLCKLLQEAATAHAAKLGVAVESLREAGVAWVLSHLRLRVERWPGPDAEIVVKTWPEAANRLLVERRFEVLDRGGEVMVGATTIWLVLDLESRRPVRLPGAIAEAVARHEIDSQPMRPENLAGPDPADREAVFTVRRSDLDLADHVNNTSYVEWAIEAVPHQVWVNHEPSELDISYLSECHHGQTIVSSSRTVDGEGGLEVRHRLVRQEDGLEVARARTAWRPPR